MQTDNIIVMPNQPMQTRLEDDLETILETDQESNYMTTARTNLQKSQLDGNAASLSKNCSTIPIGHNLNQS